MAVVVEQYNPDWPSQFETIKASLESYLDSVNYLTIEHVGSTSVPGLAAKPILDIDIIVSRADVQPAISALVSKGGFMHLGELGIIDRHVLRAPDQDPKRNIYVCVADAAQTRNHIGVRDTLRANPALRDEYAAVKLDMAARGTNIIDYIDGKNEIIQKIMRASGLLSAEELAAINHANRKVEIFGATPTERLLLREFVWADIDPFFELESKPEVVRYQTWPPRTKQQARELVAAVMADSAAVPRSHFELAIEYEGRFIGRVGANVKPEEDGLRHADLWFSLEPAFQGRGFAREAVEKFIELLGGSLELEIECDPRNTSCWRLAERLGFEKVKLTEKAFECKGEWVGSLVYRKRV